MTSIPKILRNEIVKDILTILSIIPLKSLFLLQQSLERDDSDLTTFKEQTALYGPHFEYISSFLTQKKIERDVFLLVLQTAIAVREQNIKENDTCELTWTGPINFAVPARNTINVIQEMILGAVENITIVGYRIEDYAIPLLRTLFKTFLKGVRIRFVFDNAENQKYLLQRIWNSDNLPEIYTRSKNRDPKSSIHAKIILVDSRDVLVTSANLTYHGLRSNLEVGVRIKGQLGRNLEILVNELIRSGHLILV